MTARSTPRLARGVVGVAALALAALTGTAAPAQTAPASADAGGIKFGQPGAPIDATANSQQVFQQEHRVVMTGNVEVIQGTSRLRTPQLTLWYNNNNAVKAPGVAPAGAPSNAINRMEAEGPVYFVTPTQSAKGDHGTYVAADDTITLTGSVVLTQDKNVSTGDKLVIHQKTGLATLSSEKASGRVRGVFYNEKKDDGAKPAAASATPASAPKAR